MKFALFTEGFFPYKVGGIEKHTTLFAKELLQQGHQVYLFHSCEIDKNDNELISHSLNGVELIYVDFPSFIYFPGHYIFESITYSKLLLSEYLKRNLTCEILFFQGFTSYAFLNSEKFSLSTLVVHLHGLNMYQKVFGVKAKMEAFFLRFITNKILSKSKVVITLGGRLTKIIEDRISADCKVIYFPNGIEYSKVINFSEKKSSEKLQVVFIGRNDKIKGFEILKSLIDYYALRGTIHWNLVGDFSKVENTDQITYYGLIKEEKALQEILIKGDVVLSTSFSEGFPYVLLEGMAYGNAVIASNVGANSLLVDSSNGWLVDSGNINAFKTVLDQAYEEWITEGLNNKKLHSINKSKNKFVWADIVRQLVIELGNILQE